MLIKPQIDANNKKFENGKKGGASIGNQNVAKTTDNQSKITEKQPKNNQKQPKNKQKAKENVKEEDKDVNDICAEQPQAVDTAPPADEPQNQNPHSQKEDLEPIPQELQGLNLYEADLKLRKRWQELRQAWSEAYPGVDIAKQIRAAHAAQVERDRPILLKMFKEWRDKHPEFRQSAP